MDMLVCELVIFFFCGFMFPANVHLKKKPDLTPKSELDYVIYLC